MAGRIVFELFIFSIPFIVFGLYLLATSNAEQEGKRKWPINILFLCGIGLATVAWFVLIQCIWITIRHARDAAGQRSAAREGPSSGSVGRVCYRHQG